MNQLMSAYSGSFGILACPSNQFGKQQTIDDHELLASLQHLRPGDGYEPMFQHSSKIDVNGKTSHPLFAWLRSQLPFPADQTTDSCAIASVWHNITWMPVTRTDIAWNFGACPAGVLCRLSSLRLWLCRCPSRVLRSPPSLPRSLSPRRCRKVPRRSRRQAREAPEPRVAVHRLHPGHRSVAEGVTLGEGRCGCRFCVCCVVTPSLPCPQLPPNTHTHTHTSPLSTSALAPCTMPPSVYLACDGHTIKARFFLCVWCVLESFKSRSWEAQVAARR